MGKKRKRKGHHQETADRLAQGAVRLTTAWRQGLEVFGLRFRQHMETVVMKTRHGREFAELGRQHRIERESLGMPVDRGGEEAWTEGK